MGLFWLIEAGEYQSNVIFSRGGLSRNTGAPLQQLQLCCPVRAALCPASQQIGKADGH